jgi:uncharacterized protein DUF6232
MDEGRTLRLAKQALQAGDKRAGIDLILQVIRQNPHNETAWLWLSALEDDPQKERDCLARVLEIDPDNESARQHLAALGAQSASPPPIPNTSLPTPLQAPTSQPSVRPVRDVSQERVYFRDENATITNARAIMQGRTFSMANVTSVSASKEIPQTTIPMLMMWGGGIVTLVGVFAYLLDLNAIDCAFVVGLVILIVGWFLRRYARAKYYIVIGSASGETRALWSYDWPYVAKIVAAVNQAIVERG